MPPRKKARVSLPDTPAAATPATNTATATAPAQQSEAPPKPGCDPESLVADPWSAEQETALLKGVIKWKPVGLHKHFRMLAISDYLQSQGYSPVREKHTTIPNIWKKLGTMYNLAGLDEREDPMVFDGSEEFEEDNGLYCPFELPVEEYGEMMFDRRLAPDSMSSPPMSLAGGSVRGSTAAETDEPRSSPVPPRARGRPTRGTRQSARSTRATRLQAEASGRSQSRDKTSVRDEESSDNAEEESEEEKTEMDEEDENETPAASPPPPSKTKKGQATRGKGKKTRAAPKRGRRR
ncbi:CT20 family protein [Ascosphaera apis ARSEF 7405]|uniref:CT20 family protein n=1 Tax=Ascosphaera apis ARSEF 7405 TaxID=392613 RepID=A0A168DNF0_9EURO|nr:CT20 family protein [Ascosphaera apis ARSEF 7405]